MNDGRTFSWPNWRTVRKIGSGGFGTVYEIESFNDLKKPNEIIPKVREQCRSCVYYPKCGGGCRAAYSCRCEYDACFMERYKTEFLINKISGVGSEVDNNDV